MGVLAPIVGVSDSIVGVSDPIGLAFSSPLSSGIAVLRFRGGAFDARRARVFEAPLERNAVLEARRVLPRTWLSKPLSNGMLVSGFGGLLWPDSLDSPVNSIW